MTRRILSSLAAVSLATMVAAQSPAPATRLEWAPDTYRHAGGEEPVERATLIVPERHGVPGGTTLQLAVLRFKSRSPQPGSPFIYLAGGPGSSAIESGRGRRFPLFAALREHGDVVLVDQRGVGYSRPSLNCLERWGFDLAAVRTWQSMVTLVSQRFSACLARLTAAGVDPAAYNTRESAADIELLRQALGAPQVRLVGISYGTHLGLAVMRQTPRSVERAVLAGIVGPDHVLKLPSNIDRIFDRFSAEAAADPGWSTQPSLAGMVRQVIARLEASPARVTLDRSGQSVSVSVSPFDVRILISVAMEDRETMAGVPRMIAAMARGDFRAAAAQLAGLAEQPIPSAMNLLVECASGGTATRRAQIRLQEPTALIGRVIDIPQPDICPTAGATDLGDGFRAQLNSSIPTLLVSGELDLRTPPSNADEVSRGITAASRLLLTRAGHDDDLLVGSADVTSAIVAFLRSGQVPDQSIILPPIPFLAP